ncbi:MAG: hypothetical protein EB127_03890 [Alphaproteobacteria bacterium]|nr:hypothetical protein [Alphaproteobacteria bacterium]
MEYSQSVLVDLYTWCFSVAPDNVSGNLATSTDGSFSLDINQETDSYGILVWCVKAIDPNCTITSFEVDLAICIDIFKAAWLIRQTPT